MTTIPKDKHYDSVEALWWQMHAETSSTSTIALVACTLALLLVIIGMLIFMYLLGVRTLQERAQAAMQDSVAQERIEPLTDLEDNETLLDAPPSYDDVMSLLIGLPKPPPYDPKSKPVQRSQTSAKRPEQRVSRKSERRHKIGMDHVTAQSTSSGIRAIETTKNSKVLTSSQKRSRYAAEHKLKNDHTDNNSTLSSQLSKSEPNLLMSFSPIDLPGPNLGMFTQVTEEVSVRPKNSPLAQKPLSFAPIQSERKAAPLLLNVEARKVGCIPSNKGSKVNSKLQPEHVFVSFCDCDGACSCPQTRASFICNLWETGDTNLNTKCIPVVTCPTCSLTPKLSSLVEPNDISSIKTPVMDSKIRQSNSTPNFPSVKKSFFFTYLSHNNLQFP